MVFAARVRTRIKIYLEVRVNVVAVRKKVHQDSYLKEGRNRIDHCSYEVNLHRGYSGKSDKEIRPQFDSTVST